MILVPSLAPPIGACFKAEIAARGISNDSKGTLNAMFSTKMLPWLLFPLGALAPTDLREAILLSAGGDW